MKGFLEIFIPFALIIVLLGVSFNKAPTTSQKPTDLSTQIPSFSEDDENLFETSFIIISVPENTPEDATIYMMGNFNNWLVGDENYRFEKIEDGTYQLIIKMPPNTEIFYNYNLGFSDYVEKDFYGNERDSRKYKFEYNRDVVRDEIESW